MNKKKLQQIILVILFAVGGLIFTYPFYSNGINYVVDQYRLKEMDKRTAAQRQTLKEEMAQKNEEIKVNGIVIDHDPFDASQVTNQKTELKKHLIGSVTIPKINLSIPLYNTLTNDILENGAGVLQGTSMPTGMIGSHSVISAHRGLAERELFRHLDKLEQGDIFLVDNLDETLAYEVVKTKTVKPEETDIIKLNEEEDLVSLLTCTPYMINSHRLIVTGKRTELTNVMKNQAKKSNQKQQWKEVAVLLGIVLGLLLLLLLLLKLIKSYILLRKRFDFTFYVKDNRNQPIVDKAFIIYRKGKKKPLNREGQLFVSTTNENGKVTFSQLPGDVYTLAQEDQPKDHLVHFGVKKLKDTKMHWFKVKGLNIKTTEHKRLSLIYLKKKKPKKRNKK